MGAKKKEPSWHVIICQKIKIKLGAQNEQFQKKQSWNYQGYHERTIY